MPKAVFSPQSTAEITTRRRRWWSPRLSLRTLMVVVLVIGAPLGWVARRAAIQRRAVARVQALGGTVEYEDQRDPQGFYRKPHTPWAPDWLRRVVGDEPFQEVAGVAFGHKDGRYLVDDASIAVLADFPHLQSLTFHGITNSVAVPVTAAGLARLASLTELRILGLSALNVDEATLRVLPQWRNLELLQINNTPQPVPAASLRFAGELPRLQWLDINKLGPSTADDLAPLARLNQLVHVRLNPSPRSDAGLANLAAPALTRLVLSETEMTEATVSALIAQNPNLEMLAFDGSRLTGGLQSLARAKRLTTLNIDFNGRGDDSTFDPPRPGTPRFGDADLDALRTVPLKVMMIAGLDATDAGVTRLLASHTLQSLRLGGRGVTDASASALAAQPQIAGVILQDTGITDSGLAQLKALPNLTLLSLVDNPQLTPEGIPALQSFPKLRYSWLRQPGITSNLIDSIRAAHPGIRLEQLPAPRL